MSSKEEAIKRLIGDPWDPKLDPMAQGCREFDAISKMTFEELQMVHSSVALAYARYTILLNARNAIPQSSTRQK